MALRPLSDFSVHVRGTFLLLFLFLFPSDGMSAQATAPRGGITASIPTPRGVSNRRLFRSVRLKKIIGFLTFQRTITKCGLVGRGDGSVLALVSFAGPSARGHLFIFSVRRGGVLCSSIISRKGGDNRGCTASFSGRINSCGDSLNFCLAKGACRNEGKCSLLLSKLRGKVGSQTHRHTVMIRNTTCTGPSIYGSNELKQDFNYPTLPRTLAGPVVGAVGKKDMLFVCTGGGRCVTGDSVLPGRASRRLFARTYRDRRAISTRL